VIVHSVFSARHIRVASIATNSFLSIGRLLAIRLHLLKWLTAATCWSAETFGGSPLLQQEEPDFSPAKKALAPKTELQPRESVAQAFALKDEPLLRIPVLSPASFPV
jgi:hypothetical protein